MLTELGVALAVAAAAVVCAAVAAVAKFYIRKMSGRVWYPRTGFTAEGDDQAIIDEMARLIQNRLGSGAGSRLMEMDVEERKELLAWLAGEAARVMGIAGLPDIEFLESGELGEGGERIAGQYIFVYNKLQINLDYLKIQNEKILLDTLDTVIHEMAHARQFMKMEEMLERLEDIQTEEEKEALISDPEDNRTFLWLHNRMNGNYIDFRVDPEGYRNQPLESYAFGMANAVMQRLLEGTDGKSDEN